MTPEDIEAPESAAAGSRGDIQVIGRTAQILRLFSGAETSIRVADVAAETDVGRTTAYRYLASLVNAEFLERDEDGTYSLGPLMAQLGTVAVSGLRVVELAGPHLQWVTAETRLTAVVSIWGGAGSVVARVEEPRDEVLNISVRTGTRLPLTAAQTIVHAAFLGGSDRVDQLLAREPSVPRADFEASIERAREDGYSISDGVTRGFRAVAVPVFGGDGIAATMALVGTTRSLAADPESGQLSALIEAAGRLSRELGHAA